MKSSELIKLVKKNGWSHIKTEGSHYIFEKDNVKVPVPFHGSKEVPKGTLMKIKKQMGLK